MKLIKILLITIFTVVFCYAATTRYNRAASADTPEKAVLAYSDTCVFADTSINSTYYTKAMYIGGANQSYGYHRFQCAEVGTEDVNVFVEVSNTPDISTSWIALATDANLDAVGTTAVNDTLGITAGAVQLPFKNFMWMRYKFVLGSANNDGAYITWYLGLIKLEGLCNTMIRAIKTYTEP